MSKWKPLAARFGAAALALATFAGPGRADVVTDANQKAADIAARLGSAPQAARALAIVQVSVYEALDAITGRYPAFRAHLEPAQGASVEAAVAAATHAALAALVPAQQAAIDADYRGALAAVPEGDARTRGIAVGEAAAKAILALRADDGATAAESYRPRTTPGVYVPTALPAVLQWPGRHPWLMKSAAQFRPGPPPDLKSALWARDVNEVREFGARTGSRRSDEQTAVARFWEVTQPAVYWPIARCVAAMPGRDVVDNARLFAMAAVAMDDAFVAVFDAKYAYGFWRPITAIRNGDQDGNDATPRDAGWVPFIDTPMHPEYPCAHCIISGTLGAVLQAELGDTPCPELRTSSPTAGGAERTWRSLDDFVTEVSNARIWDGVHYRNSTEVGAAMGRKVGGLAVSAFPKRGR